MKTKLLSNLKECLSELPKLIEKLPDDKTKKISNRHFPTQDMLSELEEEFKKCIPTNEKEIFLKEFFEKTSKVYFINTQDSSANSLSTSIVAVYYLAVIFELLETETKTVQDLKSYQIYIEYLEYLFSTPTSRNKKQDGRIVFESGDLIMPKSFLFSLFGLDEVKTEGIYIP